MGFVEGMSLSFSEDAFWGFLVSHSRDSIVCMGPGIFELYKVRPNIVVAYTIGSGQTSDPDLTQRAIVRRTAGRLGSLL